MAWLNYHHLYYFWVVCKEGGFTKASLKLRIAQSAISSQIFKLEDFLGEKLMERGPRGFKLTEAGQVTLAQAEEIFRQGNDLVQYFRSGKMRSSFRVGVLGSLSKNLQLKILKPAVDDTAIEITLEVGDSRSLIERLVGYQVDVVLSDVVLPSTEADPLVQTEAASEPICLVGRSKPKGSRATFLNLLKEYGIYLPAKSSPLTSSILESLSKSSASFTVRGYIDDIAVLRLLALETNSLVALPRIGVRRELDAKELYLFHEFAKIKQSYYFVYRREGKRHPVLAKLLRR